MEVRYAAVSQQSPITHLKLHNSSVHLLGKDDITVDLQSDSQSEVLFDGFDTVTLVTDRVGSVQANNLRIESMDLAISGEISAVNLFVNAKKTYINSTINA